VSVSRVFEHSTFGLVGRRSCCDDTERNDVDAAHAWTGRRRAAPLAARRAAVAREEFVQASSTPSDPSAGCLVRPAAAHNDGSVRASVGDRPLGLRELSHAGAVVAHADVFDLLEHRVLEASWSAKEPASQTRLCRTLIRRHAVRLFSFFQRMARIVLCGRQMPRGRRRPHTDCQFAGRYARCVHTAGSHRHICQI
jgi:hypothetical protein